MDEVARSTRKIAELARRQYGHVTRVQLLRLGMRSSRIGRWVANGRLVPMHAGVYAVGYRRAEPIARAAAALLACGSAAVLSHGTALALWGLSRQWPATPELSGPQKRRRSGVTYHQTSTLTAGDVTAERGLRVTSPARTIADLRPRLSERRYLRLINDARLKGLVSTEQAAALHPEAGRRSAPTRSVFEDEVASALSRAGLADFELSARVLGREVDLLFRAQRVIVELDGWAFHSDRGSYERDRAKDAVALAQGYVTVRITWRRWHRHRAEVLRELTTVLRRAA